MAAVKRDAEVDVGVLLSQLLRTRSACLMDQGWFDLAASLLFSPLSELFRSHLRSARFAPCESAPHLSGYRSSLFDLCFSSYRRRSFLNRSSASLSEFEFASIRELQP